MKTTIDLFDEIIRILKEMPDRLNNEKLDSLRKIFEIIQNENFNQNSCKKIQAILNELVLKLNLKIDEQGVMSRIATLCN